MRPFHLAAAFLSSFTLALLPGSSFALVSASKTGSVSFAVGTLSNGLSGQPMFLQGSTWQPLALYNDPRIVGAMQQDGSTTFSGMPTITPNTAATTPGTINKLNLYGSTPSFGVGVSPSSLDYVVPATGRHSFYYGSHKVFDAGANHSNFYGANGANDWLEALIPFTSSDGALSVLSPRGASGISAGSRSSDNSSTGAQGVTPFLGIAVNDNATNMQTAYGYYGECRRYTATGLCHGFEMNVINAGESPIMTPFSIPAMLSAAGWFSCGRADAISTPCSVGLAIVNNGVNGSSSYKDKKSGQAVPINQSSPYQTGLIFGCNAIAGISYTTYPCGGTQSGTGKAIQMVTGHQIIWTPTDGTAGAAITSSITGGASYAQTLTFTNTGLTYATPLTLPLRVNPSVISGTAGNISKIDLWNGSYGFGVSASGLDYVAPSGARHNFYVAGSKIGSIGAAGMVAAGYRETLSTPSSSSAPCTTGQFTDDANYHYVCVATNTWKRVALSAF